MKTDLKHAEVADEHSPESFLPPSLLNIQNPQTEIPKIAKDPARIAQIEQAIGRIPTEHWFRKRTRGVFKITAILRTYENQPVTHSTWSTPVYGNTSYRQPTVANWSQKLNSDRRVPLANNGSSTSRLVESNKSWYWSLVVGIP